MIHADVLRERARLTPDGCALVFVPTSERFTYAELSARAERLARLLLRLGLVEGDRVGILAGNRVEFVDAFFASARTGLVLVPLNPRLTAHELAPIVRDAGLSVLLWAHDQAATVAALNEAWAVPHPIALDASEAASLEALLANLPDGELPPASIDPEDPVALLYTSGTTGVPKGVVIPHRMVAWNGVATAIGWGLRADDISPVFTPLCHAGGLFAFLVPIFTVGGTILLHERFDAAEALLSIEKERATVILVVPTIARMLLESPSFARIDLSSVRWFISGGAPLSRPVWEAFHARGLVLKQGYGLTEVGVNCFAMSEEESVRNFGSIGRPLPFTEARLADEAGADAMDAAGELLLRGPHVCTGYWRNEAATSAALDEEGWFHTGDIARRDAQGRYTIAGRRKEMFISGGVNVYPAEVETVLLQFPSIADAAVVGIPHEKWGEVGVAFLVARPGATIDTGALVGFLSERIARFKLPSAFVCQESLPRTAYGKVVKAELRTAYLESRR